MTATLETPFTLPVPTSSPEVPTGTKNERFADIDFDQLAAAGDDLLPFSQGVDYKQHRRRKAYTDHDISSGFPNPRQFVLLALSHACSPVRTSA